MHNPPAVLVLAEPVVEDDAAALMAHFEDSAAAQVAVVEYAALVVPDNDA